MAEELVRPGQNDFAQVSQRPRRRYSKDGRRSGALDRGPHSAAPACAVGGQSKPMVAPSPLGEGRTDGIWLINAVCHKTADGIESNTLDAVGDVTKNIWGRTRGEAWLVQNGRPDWADGTSRLKVDGTVLYPKAAPAGQPLGAPFSHPIIAKFENTRGTGRRVGSRHHDFVFVKQS